MADTVDSSPTDGSARDRFVERFALSLNAEGFPRMSARVFAAVLTSDEGRLTAAELAETLAISPAAVSGAVRYLTGVRLLERERLPGTRRDTYRILDDVWFESLTRADDRFARWADDLAAGIEAVGPGTDAARRLDDAREFFEFLRASFPGLVASWKARKDRRSVVE